MKLEDHRIIFYTYQLLVLKPPNHGLVFHIVDLQSSFVPSPLVFDTNRERKQEEDEDKNRVYNRKNTDLDSRLQIWLLFRPELIENKQIWNWWEWLKQQPNIPNIMIIYWKEQNQQKQNKFWKTTQNKLLQQDKNLILETKENTIQTT